MVGRGIVYEFLIDLQWWRWRHAMEEMTANKDGKEKEK